MIFFQNFSQLKLLSFDETFDSVVIENQANIRKNEPICLFFPQARYRDVNRPIVVSP